MFLDTDWTYTILSINHPLPAGSIQHVATGGNPDDHAAITSTSCSVVNPDGCHVVDIGIYSVAVYDPSVSGPIGSIEYQEDQACFSVDGCVGDGTAWSPAIEQSGKFYIIPGMVTSVQTTNWVTQSLTNLTATAFEEIFLSGSSLTIPTSHPDFGSPGAPPLRFGYARANSRSSGRTSRIDNWTLKVFPAPVPVESATWSALKALYR